MRQVFYLSLGGLALIASAYAQPLTNRSPAAVPYVAPASGEAELALQRFQAPPGFKVDLWAAEPMLANPVTFNFEHFVEMAEFR